MKKILLGLIPLIGFTAQAQRPNIDKIAERGEDLDVQQINLKWMR